MLERVERSAGQKVAEPDQDPMRAVLRRLSQAELAALDDDLDLALFSGLVTDRVRAMIARCDDIVADDQVNGVPPKAATDTSAASNP